ncbi:MAP7 domain-containing protein 2-like isoform X2 [Pristis pectinata]|uniref:MAP7 domain-containing protein 2-like isoform X2 n=1 Tax=Pristis pectinata TaxID=685728 RepID=UPI00223CA7E3|nr:MAP7 domain-containing protein 2-like isoform X2 [Pristis pectinata]
MAEVLAASPRRSDVHQSKRDDRQRLAKERREERDRSLAVREQQILQKERKARLLYEKQMEERWRKLEEQRQREEQRRAAVEEKRRQRLEEEKERHEAMMRRTLERNQQLEQRQKRWSWGGAAPTGTGTRDGESENTPPPPIDLAANTYPPEPVVFDAAASNTAADRFPAPAVNLPKQMESPVCKLPPSSAAAFPRPPERVSGSPLKTPSKPTSPSGDRQSAAATSSSPGETKGSPMSETQQGVWSRPQRNKVPGASRKKQGRSGDGGRAEMTEKAKKEKKHPSGVGSSVTSTFRRSQSPANMSKRSSSPAVKTSSKVRTQSPSSSKEFPPSPTSSGKSSPMRRRLSSNSIAESGKKSREKGEVARQKSEETEQAEGEPPAATTPVKEHERKKAAVGEDTSSTKTMAGTTNPEEAAKLLAERRRLARLQKEIEEQERREQEEAERKLKEELQRKEAEEKARREEEARKLEEERRRQELECQRRAEEERILREQQEKELLARLEQQREEAETKAREAAERQRQIRQQAIQQIEQERLERKKRIEEIMKRTRRSDVGETKKEEIKVEVLPNVNMVKEHQTLTSVEPVQVSTTLVCLESKQDEAACSAVTPSEAVPALEVVPDLEVVPATEQVDEQPNSVDDSTDELQSMDVSPMSKDEGISIPEFSPLNEVSQDVELEKDRNGLSDAQAVEDLIDLTGHSTYNKLSQDKISLDDCNKNLIEGQCISTEENPLITSLTKSVEETHIQTSAEL